MKTGWVMNMYRKAWMIFHPWRVVLTLSCHFSPLTFPVHSLFISVNKKKERKKVKHTEKWTFHTVLLESWFMICMNFKSFTFYLGDLHTDEKMCFLLSEWNAELGQSENLSPTSRKQRLQLPWYTLHQQQVVKWSYDHFFFVQTMRSICCSFGKHRLYMWP